MPNMTFPCQNTRQSNDEAKDSQNVQSVFKVEEYASCTKSQSELMEEILEVKQIMEVAFEN